MILIFAFLKVAMEDHSSAQVVEEEEEFSLLSEKRKLSKPVQKQRKKPNKECRK
jgi:hypothetical protein